MEWQGPQHLRYWHTNFSNIQTTSLFWSLKLFYNRKVSSKCFIQATFRSPGKTLISLIDLLSSCMIPNNNKQELESSRFRESVGLFLFAAFKSTLMIVWGEEGSFLKKKNKTKQNPSHLESLVFEGPRNYKQRANNSTHLPQLLLLEQWFSTFPTLQPSHTCSSSCRSGPNHSIILLLLRNCNFATAINYNINIKHAAYLIWTPKWVITHRLRATVLRVFFSFRTQPLKLALFLRSNLRELNTTI